MHFKPLFFLFFFVSVCLSSCEFKCSVGTTTGDKDEQKHKPVEKDGMLLYNGIKVNAHLVKLNKAFLVNGGAEGKRLDEDNFIDVDKGVKLILLVDSGWKDTDNKVLLGASMKAVADNGQELFNNEDLFGNSSISSEDSKILALSLSLTQWQAKRPVTINVSFKIWDKNSDASLEGSYTVHTK